MQSGPFESRVCVCICVFFVLSGMWEVEVLLTIRLLSMEKDACSKSCTRAVGAFNVGCSVYG